MDAIQEQHERAVGEQFMEWYNAEHGTRFQFSGRAGDAPDLVFRDERSELRLEVTDSYYDAADAEIRWKHARRAPNPPGSWSGVNFDQALARHIGERLKRKARNTYGGTCFLVVNTNPALTTASELEALIPAIAVPVQHSFSAIYLVGHFGWSSSGEQGGYRCWQLA